MPSSAGQTLPSFKLKTALKVPCCLLLSKRFFLIDVLAEPSCYWVHHHT